MSSTIVDMPEVIARKKTIPSSAEIFSNPIFQPDWKLKIIGGSSEINVILFSSGYYSHTHEVSEDTKWRFGADGAGVTDYGFIHPILAGSMHADASLLEVNNAPVADKPHFLSRRWDFLIEC